MRVAANAGQRGKLEILRLCHVLLFSRPLSRLALLLYADRQETACDSTPAITEYCMDLFFFTEILFYCVGIEILPLLLIMVHWKLLNSNSSSVTRISQQSVYSRTPVIRINSDRVSLKEFRNFRLNRTVTIENSIKIVRYPVRIIWGSG